MTLPLLKDRDTSTVHCVILPGVPLPSPEDRDLHYHTKTVTVVQPPVITAGQDSLSGVLRGVDSSREEIEEDQSGNLSSTTQRLDTPPNSHQPTLKTDQECSTRSVPPRSLSISKQYNQICTTHKKLVKSGAVTCSVSLSDTPPTTVNLPSAPSSPLPVQHQLLEGSVHFGIVGDFSGVQTPETSPVETQISVRGVSVIQCLPPALPARGAHLRPPSLPPASSYPTPTSTRSGLIPRRLSSTDPNLLDSSEIPAVSRPGSTQEVFEPGYSSIVWDQGQEVISTMENMCLEQAAELKRKRKRLTRKMFEFKEEDINTSRIQVMERDFDRINDMKDDYQDDVEDFIDKYRNTIQNSSALNQWAEEVITVGEEVKDHADRIRTRAALISTPRSSDTEARSLQIQEAALKLQEMSLKEQQHASAEKVREKSAQDMLLAESEANILLGECSVLGDMVTDEADWEVVEDDVVENAMRNLGKWQDQMNNVERAFRKYENMALQNTFPEDKKEAILATYEDYRQKFETARNAAKKQDTDRGLFTLEPTKSDIIKYPTFSGSPSEDFLKFRETMEQRFRENKVKKKEQVAKLRECLKAAALGRVPEGIKDIEEAFRRLQEAFGNPSKVMAHSLKSLEDLGTLPPEKLNNQYNYARQIEFYLKLEVILGKILELSKRSSKLAHEAFSSSIYRKLWARFPTSLLQKLVKVRMVKGLKGS